MKKYFNWCDEWLSGIEALDVQHASLAEYISEVMEACCPSGNSAASNPVNVNQLFDNLLKKIQDHFEYEETIMQKTGFPGFSSHKREHVMLHAELKSILVRDLESAAAGEKLVLLRELRTWFAAHANHSDCAFSAYIKKMKRDAATSTVE